MGKTLPRRAASRGFAIEHASRSSGLGWNQNTWAGRADFVESPDAGRGGVACLRIMAPYGTDAGWSRPVTVKPRTRYKLSGWIRTRDVDPETGMGAVLNVLGRREVCTPPLTGTTDWTHVEIEFTTGSETSLQILCLFGGWGSSSGAAWYEGVRLDEVRWKADSTTSARSTDRVRPGRE